jgi:methylmalonyl-CoA mutase N-terminal domain/subunit
VQGEVAYQAYRYERGVQDGSIPKVGVNRYRMEEEKRDMALHPYDPKQAEESIRRTAEVIAARDAGTVDSALQKVRDAASNGQNTMPALIEAVRAYATIGEITKTLKEVFGEYAEQVRL